ncbi:guanylate kinase [Phragmitibacter flavus]|uniref:Guanylate kinase n=2 Tax=Phragmitibacter flavus TaxID=2576071 RepID=A0A5R8KBQ2_9BACT|nr:guanylate kinase [Phragmitibacter flavus]
MTEIKMPDLRLGVLLVVSGPSGSGKTTLCRRLCRDGEAVFSVSCTTRPPRVGEVNGRDYFFLDEETFMARVEKGEFFEWARVHGNLYGTLKSYVTELLLRGEDVMLDIDVQGAAQVRECEDEVIQRCLADVFILPPSVEELDRRLTGRGSESAERHALRMENAVHEMAHWKSYRHALVSGAHEEDYVRFGALLVAERMRVSRYLGV